MTIFIIYTTDAHHYWANSRVAAVRETIQEAREFIMQHAEQSEEGAITGDEKLMLEIINQTQNRAMNYRIDEWDTHGDKIR